MKVILRYLAWVQVMLLWPSIKVWLSTEARLAALLGDRFDPAERLLQALPASRWLPVEDRALIASVASSQL